MAVMKPAFSARLLTLPILCLGLLPLSAHAQSEPDEIVTPGGVLPAGIVYRPLNPAEALTYNLGILSRNPRDLTALTQAGLSALAVGDANAAIGFLGRAEQLSPGSGRIKLSLGTALVMLERPLDALHFFAQALALGVPARDIVKDRGLARDLLGEQSRAQEDYQLALRYGPDEEATRRLALSYGISGDKDQALRLLDPLIKKQDQAAWRNRAFILAMNGDQRGAERIVEQVMPYGASGTMTPFLRRLASLGAADRAHAVSFGTISADSATRTASIDPDSGFRAINLRVAEALAPPSPPVQVAQVFDDRSDRKKRKDKGRNKRGDEQQLALATTNTVLASAPAGAPRPGILPPPSGGEPVASQPVAAPRSTTASITRRVGARIGPVDQSRLPPELRDGGKGKKGDEGRFVQVAGTALPAPTNADLLAQASSQQPEPAAPRIQQQAPRVQPSEPATPPPLFELPAKSSAPQLAVAVKPAEAVSSEKSSPILNTPRLAEPLPAAVITTQAAQTAPAFNASVAIVPASIPPAVSSAVSDRPAIDPAPKLAAPGFDPAVINPVGEVAELQPQVKAPAAAPSADPTPLPNPAITPPVAAQAKAPPPSEPLSLASIIAGVETEAESPATAISVTDLRKARLKAQADAKSKADAKVKADAEAAALEKEKLEKAAKRKHPERYWVQVGTGNNRAGLSGTFKKLREQAPDALKSVPTAVAPFKSTNRLLVGPFKTAAEAKAKVNELAKKGISANSYTSDPGEEVATVSVK